MSKNILSPAIPNKFMNGCGELSGATVVGGVKTHAVSSATRWGGKPAATSKTTDVANKVFADKEKQSPGASPLIQEDAPGR